ncbi:MAG: type III-B CRISPR module-associated Cmr3 family protein [Limnochordia bacterium]
MLPITIYPRDPLVARDGRPYGRGAGNRMYCLPWPYPSVVAGSLRTMLGKEIAGRRDAFADQVFVDKLKEIRVRGPLPLYDDQLYFPRPRNFLRAREKEKREYTVERLEPRPPGPGCGLNLPGLWPLTAELRDKPDLGEALWPADMLYAWLLREDPFVFDADQAIAYPSMEERVHVEIDRDKRVAVDGALFTTQGLDFTWGADRALAIRATLPDLEWVKMWGTRDLVHPAGGERRLAVWKPRQDDGNQWAMPSDLAKHLAGAQRVCMYVATPAVFAGGWRPGWLDPDDFTGLVPDTGLEVRLRGAAVGRWQPVSGWSYEQRGPKPIRRLVPAGSVYFFDVLSGDPAELSGLWLQSLSDDEGDAQDGFGLVCWGVWGEQNA